MWSDLDEEFWEAGRNAILSDVGGAAASDIVENLRDKPPQALPTPMRCSTS
ncbi:MAG: hypothetical protein ACLSGS_01345 [Adlercreutzia sp.]